VPFLKVNDGDTLTLAANARVQMVYLSSGRQEVWTGAGPVKVGTQQSASSLTPQASQVPALDPATARKDPAVGQHGKTGMVMLRSVDDLGALDTARKGLSRLPGEGRAGRRDPEVFYLTGLLDLGDTQTARKVLDDLKSRQATQPAYGPVVEHFRRLTLKPHRSSGGLQTPALLEMASANCELRIANR
jgi:hypothetical protein